MKHYPYRTFDPTEQADAERVTIHDIHVVKLLHKDMARRAGRSRPDNHEAYMVDDGTVFYFTDHMLIIFA